MRNRTLTTADYKALGAFRFALREFLALSEAAARSLGLTVQQHQALLGIRAHEGPEAISVGELAAWLMIRNHSALGLISRLEVKGLVERHASTTDRRRVTLTLGPTAERLLDEISRNNLRELRRNAPAFANLLAALEQLEPPPTGKRASRR